MSAFRSITAQDLARLLPFKELVEALRAQYQSGCTVPPRHHHTVDQGSEPESTLLLMPAWDDEWLGIKNVTVTPGNGARDLPTVSATYLLYRKQTGELAAIIDGAELTARRTAANSALAADLLAHPDAKRMLMVGTGKLGSNLPLAHASVRPLERIDVWGRRHERAVRLASELQAAGLNAYPVESLETACREADIISCATLAKDALIKGEWLKPGSHLDLVGAFRPDMREADAQAVAGAWLAVDHRAGVLAEAGDVLCAISEGAITQDHIEADLPQLCQGTVQRPNDQEQRTAFKSVGMALQDLCAAKMALR
ncbi:MAG: ornithine cyclodeaminase family protein [Fimbriimonadaceae bacterium]|nr:ornithine cyclodeaminase family protein [Fimbriimonadaceae bacterium]